MEHRNKHTHTKYFQIAGLSIEVKSDLPITPDTFNSKFDSFEIQAPLADNIIIQHLFSDDLKKIAVHPENRSYFKPPWAIYNQGCDWIYQWIHIDPPYQNYYRTVVTDKEHTFLDIYNDKDMKKKFLEGNLTSLTMFPTDQILVGRLLAYKNGCILHSLGISLDDRGYIFIGHSSAGKSTMARMMKKEAQILCDDRNIIREKDNDYILSGTWSHGDVKEVSSKLVPLKAIFFLEQSDHNQVDIITDRHRSFERLLACLIRPLETRDWWDKSLHFLSGLATRIPCWNLQFDKSGKVSDLIKGIKKYEP